MEARYEGLSNELLARKSADQAMRKRARDRDGMWDSTIDDNNELRLKEIVDQIGWPTISLVGAQASNAAWLIVQHASDIDFMNHCLNLMKSCAPGDVTLSNIAYLDDRVRMYRDEPQLYGTQYKGMPGRGRMYTLYDPENVNARREKMGLAPIG